MERLMGRIRGFQMMLNAPRGLALALIVASAAATLSAPLRAESTKSAEPTKTKHATHRAAPAKQTAKVVPPGGCQPTPEQASIGIRALQTELMVAGLKCSAEQWNTFTTKFKTTIKIDADRMQKLFSKAYGKSGANQMNAFVTQLANDASQRSNGFSEADYCKQQDVLFQKVLAFTSLELERFSAGRALAVPAPVALCKPDTADTAPPANLVVTTAPPAATGAVSLRK
jgi:hypothetical protein